MRGDCPEALMWDIVFNKHGYTAKPGHAVLDIGAHHGIFSVFCAMRGAEVRAYEPDTRNFARLQENWAKVATLKGKEIFPIKKAVWSETGERRMWLDPDNSGAHSLVSPRSNLSVTVETDSLSKALSGRLPWDCVKVDVEGAEAQIFLSAKREDFRRIKFLTLDLHSGVLTLDQNNALLKRLGQEFPRVHTFPEVRDGLPTGRTAKVFCWGSYEGMRPGTYLQA